MKRSDDECTIPGPVPAAVLSGLVLGAAPHRGSEIREYVEWQSPDEKVLHLEKMATEHLLDRKLDVWDVQTTGERYWVITNPTNLYSQQLFPSMDYTLSFHIGVTTRVLARRETSIDDPQQKRFAVAWRKWLQAADAFDERTRPKSSRPSPCVAARHCFRSFAGQRMMPSCPLVRCVPNSATSFIGPN